MKKNQRPIKGQKQATKPAEQKGSLVAAKPTETIESLTNRLDNFMKRGKYRNAYSVAIDLARKTEQETDFDPTDIVMAYLNSATLAFLIKEYGGASRFYEKAIAILDPPPPNSDEESYNLDEESYNSDQKPLHSEKKPLDLVKIKAELNPQLHIIYQNIGISFIHIKDIEKGIAYFLKSCAVLEDKKEEDDNFLGALYFTIGEIYFEIGRNEESIDILKKILQINENDTEKNIRRRMIAYQYIGSNYQLLDDYEKAVMYLKKSCRELEENNSEDSVLKGLLTQNVGNAYLLQNEYSNALNYYQEALLAMKNNVPDNDAKLLEIIQNFKKAYKALKLDDDEIDIKPYKTFLKTHFSQHLANEIKW